MFATSAKYHLAFWAILLFLMPAMTAQNFQDRSASDLKYLAVKSEQRGDHLSAAEFYSELVRRKPKQHKLQYQLARNLHLSSKFDQAAFHYSELQNEYADQYPLAAFYLGRIKIMQGKCGEAVPILENFRDSYRGEENERLYRRMAKFSIQACDELERSKESSVIVKPLSANINGPNLEASPIFQDEENLIYISLKADPDQTYDLSEEELPKPAFYRAKRKEGGWQQVGLMEMAKLPAGYAPTAGAFNQDKSRFYFSACKDFYKPDKRCDIFKIEYYNGEWSEAVKIEEISGAKTQESHPAIGVDEKGRETIYFVSDREGGKGGKDIWYATYYEAKKSYREPRNLGSKVNSVGDEITPFVDPESGKLYFSSNGHPSYGGFDIFSSVGSRSKWKEPENLGSDINSPMDELDYSQDPDGRSGIFASNRQYAKKKQPCCDDLFYFTDPDLIAITYKGELQDEKQNSLNQVTVSVYELDDSTGERYLRKRFQNNNDGSYQLRLDPEKQYEIVVEKEGYFKNRRKVSTMNQISSTEKVLDLELKQMTEKAFVLENVYYDFDSPNLKAASRSTIDTTIYKILVENPALIVEIGSHTDSEGNESYNQRLSQRRAESVVKYLIQKGIDRKRLKAVGYGEKNPIAKNKNEDGSDNPEGRAKNRRTEFKVIGKLKLREDDDFN